MSFLKELLLLFPNHWVQEKVNSLKKVKWKNDRAGSKTAYVPTPVEHLANVITHGIGVPCSLIGTCLLLEKSKTKAQASAALVYGVSLLLLFMVSTCFHCVHYSGHYKLKVWLHRGDRAMIYVFIAASYFPWLVLRPLPHGYCVPHMWWLIWVLALLGIAYQQTYHEKYRTLETCIYLLVALGPSAFILQDDGSSDKLKLGGVIYGIGIVFFKSDGVIPFAHAIWHLFVGIAASIHFYAVQEYLYS